MLPTISTIFERLLFDQLRKFLNKFLSPPLCGFKKGYSTQKWGKKSTDGFDGLLVVCQWISLRHV